MTMPSQAEPELLAMAADLPLNELRQMQNEVNLWARRNFGGGRAWMALVGAGEEVGELEEHADITGLPRLIGALMHAHLKREQGIRGSSEQHYDAMVDAVADITIYLLDFSNEVGIDFALALALTWEQVSQRDWKRKPGDGRTA